MNSTYDMKIRKLMCGFIVRRESKRRDWVSHPDVIPYLVTQPVFQV